MSDEDGSTRKPPAALTRRQQGQGARLLRVLGLARYIVTLAVLSTFVASALLLVYGSVQTVVLVIETISQDGPPNEWAQHLRLQVIEVIDLFLIATVLFVIAVGLFQLFFVGGESQDLQGVGIAVAVVIVALSYFLGQLHHSRSRGGD